MPAKSEKDFYYTFRRGWSVLWFTDSLGMMYIRHDAYRVWLSLCLLKGRAYVFAWISIEGTNGKVMCSKGICLLKIVFRKSARANITGTWSVLKNVLFLLPSNGWCTTVPISIQLPFCSAFISFALHTEHYARTIFNLHFHVTAN